MEKATHFVTGKSRLSYVSLTQPRTPMGGGDPKFSVTVLVPKSDVATKARIDAAVKAAAQQGVSKQWNGVMPQVVATPLYDGDGSRANGDAFGTECKGCWVFTASSKMDKRPRVVDMQVQDIMDPSELYSGMYGRVGVDAYPYNRNGKRGIAFGLVNVQKMADGEPLGNMTSAEDDFGSPVVSGGINPVTGMPL